ncbi:MAG: metallophosphoesterase, partial [Oscillospiraceae bacterium]|nr:metallophosphoesterase [Oscillospiraceae bacterium]
MRINRLIASEYEIASEKIGKCFDGLSFVYLADLHNVCVGEKNCLVTDYVRAERPAFLLLGGDMITEQKYGKHGVFYDNAVRLILDLAETVPVYYSIGNHERRWQDPQPAHDESFETFRELLSRAGVRFLDNRSVKIHRGTEYIRVTGLSLPTAYFGRKRRQLAPAKIDGYAGHPDR